MLFRSGDIRKYQFYGSHFGKWPPFQLFGQVQLIEICFIGFLVPENICLALKTKALCYLEAEIQRNISFMAAILKNGRQRTFHHQDSLRVLICYRGHISGYKTVDRLSVAICERLTPFFSRNAWTTMEKNGNEIT